MEQQTSTTSPPTCEPQSAPNLEWTDRICETHGAVKVRVLDGFDGKRIIGHCSQCREEREAAELARKERQARFQREHRVATLRAAAGIPARFADRTFDGYAAETQGQKIALASCRTFAKAWPDRLERGGSLVLSGGPGTGKTHLAAAVGNYVMQEHLATVAFGTVFTMLRHIKDTYRKDSQKSEQDAIDDLVQPNLLILDEVGVQTGSEHEKLLMFEVLNARYQELAPTILISNLSPGELEAFLGQRVMDRYRECGHVIAFDWQSYRGRK